MRDFVKVLSSLLVWAGFIWLQLHLLPPATGYLWWVLDLGIGLCALYLIGSLVSWLVDSSMGLAGNQATYPDDWVELRMQVLARDGYRCANCPATHGLHVHHIVPLSKGGTNQLSNLIVLCEDCHKKLHPHMR
jgi:hypothetical protein